MEAACLTIRPHLQAPRVEIVPSPAAVSTPALTPVPKPPTPPTQEGPAKDGKKKHKKKRMMLSIEDVTIPPIIRHLHPKLTISAYKR